MRVRGVAASLVLACLLAIGVVVQAGAAASPLQDVFAGAARDFGVPAPILEALCETEGRMNMHQGVPSIDGGHGCMHLVDRPGAATLSQAARDLGVDLRLLRTDLATNVRGGAAVLRDTARGLAQEGGGMPRALGDWYAPLAAYSHARSRATALMYADAVYRTLARGFHAVADGGERIAVAPRALTPNRAPASRVRGAGDVPAGCADDGHVDYPGAIDCVLDGPTFDCARVPKGSPCSYESADRPHDLSIGQVVVHDVEGTAQDALEVFQDPASETSVHYIVDGDGTVYQVLREKDVPYAAGSLWYNRHSIDIEHAGYAATGWQWYDATEYLASARLVAYLLRKYDIPLDHAHVLSHGSVPAPSVGHVPNHVDPGPYWLWDYYLELIHEQGVPSPDRASADPDVFSVSPENGRAPDGEGGAEAADQFTYLYLYQGPSTASGLVPGLADGADPTDESIDIEPQVSYAALDRRPDAAGSGATMYEIWYGEYDRAHADDPSLEETAHRAWLAVPPGAALEGDGTVVTLGGRGGGDADVYGRPTTGAQFRIGSAPAGARFVSPYTVREDGSGASWYAIDFDHRQAWVPAAEVHQQIQQ